MREDDRKYLKEIRDWTDHPVGIYPGMHPDALPRHIEKRLRGLIEPYEPHNMAHKIRWIITKAGRAALAQQ